jgi:type IV secretory pathway protease TraF
VWSALLAAPGLGVGLNLASSGPRGLYSAVADAPARGAFVTACLPPEIAVFGRARGDPRPRCPGGTQPVLTTIGAVAGDRVDLGGESVSVNAVPLLRRNIEAFDSATRSLPNVTFGSYPAADDQVRLFGLSQGHSCDSRYLVIGRRRPRVVRVIARQCTRRRPALACIRPTSPSVSCCAWRVRVLVVLLVVDRLTRLTLLFPDVPA